MSGQPSAEKGLLTEAEREALSDWQSPGHRLEATVERIVRERCVQAWDEGAESAVQDLNSFRWVATDNPYRATPPDEAAS